MNIVVCIKQVPDTTEVKLDPKTGTLIREGVPSIINPDDKAGLEAALRLKDQYGAKVTVVSMGPAQADAALKEAVAMGADEAILLSDRAFGGSDTWATSTVIASALKKLDYDLIITGDLGTLGHEIVLDLLRRDGMDPGDRYQDCGMLLYDIRRQDMHCGASGCGCSAAVLNAYLLPGLRAGKWNKILFAPTGALLSPTSSFQGESIPGICHAVCISASPTT